MLSSKDVHILMPGTCGTWQRGVKIADEIKAAHQLTLRCGGPNAAVTLNVEEGQKRGSQRQI